MAKISRQILWELGRYLDDVYKEGGGCVDLHTMDQAQMLDKEGGRGREVQKAQKLC